MEANAAEAEDGGVRAQQELQVCAADMQSTLIKLGVNILKMGDFS